MSPDDDGASTVPLATPALCIERVTSFQLTVLAGPDAGLTAASKNGLAEVGRREAATLRLTDPTVSWAHVELRAAAGGVRVTDLRSANGTLLHGARVLDAVVSGPVELAVGGSRVRLTIGERDEAIAAIGASRFHGMIGGSQAMRAVYARLQSAGPTTSTVLLLGESGTGKELAAQALHASSARGRGPFEVVNCGGLPPTLVESELFGHARGAFTGAFHTREGAFERADGGTIFLDEIGELPLESQPKLLRVLESGQFQRVGDTQTRRADVRVVAATHRDLRGEVNAGRFRADLYYRLAVIHVRLPPLRERLDDLPAIAADLVARIRRDRGVAADLPVDGALVASLRAHDWPGNVRELRNHLEQRLVLSALAERPDGAHGDAPAARPPAGAELPLREARELFERDYLVALLERNDWQILETARKAGIDRATLFRMMRRHGIERAG